jgi:hypothetical protein
VQPRAVLEQPGERLLHDVLGVVDGQAAARGEALELATRRLELGLGSEAARPGGPSSSRPLSSPAAPSEHLR